MAAEIRISGTSTLLTTLMKSLVCVMLIAPAAMGQVQLPDPVQPGRAEKQYESIPIPRSGGPDLVPGQQDLPTPDKAESLRFFLKDIQLINNTSIKTADLVDLYNVYLGKQITLADLYAIANSITARYRNLGYVLSQAIIPEQEIDEDGRVEILLIEGFVKNIHFEIPDGVSFDTLNGFGEKIRATRPLTARVLERYVLLMNDLPGISARARLAATPDGEVGASDLTIRVSHDLYNGYIGTSNRGGRFLGPGRYLVSATRNGLFGNFNSTTVSAVSTASSELGLVALNYQQPIRSEGGSVGFVLTGSKSEPGGRVGEALSVKNESTSATIEYTHPYVRSRHKNVTGNLALAIQNSHSDRVDPDTPSSINTAKTKDNVRAMRIGVTYDRVDRYRGVNLVDLKISRGIDALDATPTGDANRSRPNAETEFNKVELYAARVQQLSKNWSLLLAANAQYTGDNLPSSEQFGVGGNNFVRGYDSSEIVGDKGMSAKLELRLRPSASTTVIRNTVVYGFVDGGRISRNTTVAGAQDSESISSFGLGVRFELNRGVTGYFEYAAPMSSRSISGEGDRKGRFFFSLAKAY